MHIIPMIGGVIALATHAAWIWGVLKDRMHLNLASWLVWATMDWIALVASIKSGAPAPFLVMGFAVGATLLALTLIWKGSWHWGWIETACTVISLSCLILWYFAGPLAALVLLVCGKYTAGIPTIVQAYKNPERQQASIWFWSALGDTTNMFVGGVWTIAQSFMPTNAFIFSLVLGFIHLRRVQLTKNP